ncbi:MAG: NAD-dependent epimerase/dehydratase family protein, partial [Bacteroidota bacterium]
MRTVLVTGGTGFIGSNLAIALRDRGCAVRILRREGSNLRALGSADVEHSIGDVRDPDALRRAVKGCDTVFHTAALVSYWPRQREEMFAVNIRGTANLVASCLESGVSRFVHTSSIAAIGFTANGSPADETTPFNWDRYNVGYRISKRQAEEEVLKGVKLGLPAVIVNPSVVMGPRDIHFHGGQIVRDVARKRIFYYVKGGINVVDVGDVVVGHIRAAEQGRIGERYILSGHNLTHREMISVVHSVVGGIPPLFPLPRWFSRTLAAGAETIGNMTGTKPWITRELIAGVHLHS